MFYVIYAIVAACSLVMVYFGSKMGDSQFYMSIFSAAMIDYCLYLDYKKRRDGKKEAADKESKAGKNSKNGKHQKTYSIDKKKSPGNISQIAHKKNKDL